MLKIKPEYLSKNGRPEFVVLTVEDYERMKQAMEDADDLRTLRQALAVATLTHRPIRQPKSGAD